MKKEKRITLSQADKLNVISNLSTMISAGIPIMTAIGSLGEDAHGNVKMLLETMRKNLLEGKRIYETFAMFPDVFDEVTVNMIRSAEHAGKLDVALHDLKEQIKKDIAFRRKLRSSLTYPLLVLLVFFAIFFLILVVVIPKIATVFKQLKVDIPLPTKILIFLSDVTIHGTVYILLSLILLTLLGVYLFKTKKKKILSLLSSLPIISILVRYIDLFRFTRSLHLLMSSGITIVQALELSDAIVVNKDVKAAIIMAKQTILSGKPLSFSFKQHKKIFPGTMIELTKAGEQTGTMDKSMQDISEYLDYKVTDTLQMITALLEPAMLVLVALMVGAMMVAIIGPIYGMIGQIGPH